MPSKIPKLDQTEPPLMRWVGLITSKGKIRIVLLSAFLIALISVADSKFEPSLGVFYIVPMLLGATVLSIPEITLMALVCAVLRGLFDYHSSIPEHILGFIFAGIAYALTGFFITSAQSVFLRNLTRVRQSVLPATHQHGCVAAFEQAQEVEGEKACV